MSYTQLPLTAEPETVAVVFKSTGQEYDRCFSWETGQVYANAGFEVVAVNPDRYMSTEEAQERLQVRFLSLPLGKLEALKGAECPERSTLILTRFS